MEVNKIKWGRSENMKKYFKVYKPHPNFIQVDFIEDGIAIGGYIIPVSIYNTEKELATFLKKEGYIEA